MKFHLVWMAFTCFHNKQFGFSMTKVLYSMSGSEKWCQVAHRARAKRRRGLLEMFAFVSHNCYFGFKKSDVVSFIRLPELLSTNFNSALTSFSATVLRDLISQVEI